ncbi:ABC transporter permease/M1 family aminopeptidase [Pontibacter roseus]|uniref:ABC transporter permease/M1 family aminopeptidase n=1 Tax=Pontibacter roseus TaxID=336989 RepID=UPI000372B000|nr:hypothetical protein [Pontibacter roseus]
MKLWEIFRFELGSQLRRVSTWLYFLIFLGITFAMVASFTDNVRSGDYLLNAPVVTAAITSIASLLVLLVVAAVAGDAATHDLQDRIEPLLYTSPISKFTYLGGRFLGALAITTLVLLALPLGLMLAVFIPGIDASLFGPFRLVPYLSAFFLIALPNLFVATAILFSVALLSRHALTSFLVGGVLFIMAMVSKEVLADHMGLWSLSKQLDLSGFTLVSHFHKTLTPLQVNTELVPVDGWLVWNRVLWVLVALGMLTLAHYRFRFAHYAGVSWWSRLTRRRQLVTSNDWTAPISLQPVHKTFNVNTQLYQLSALTFQSFRENLLGWGWMCLVFLAGMLLMLVPEWLEGSLGVPTLATTGRIVQTYDLLLFRLTVVAVLVVYMGQLVWRERDARMQDIADAAPVADGVSLLAKLLSALLMLLAVQTVFLLAGLAIQLGLGHPDVELGLYLRVLFGLQLADYLLFAVLALAVHLLVNQKYMGHILFFLTFLFSVFAAELGVGQKLLVYNADSGWSYSDFSGFGLSLAPWFWFKLYWVGWAVLLALVARLFWVRGHETGIAWRLRQAVARPKVSYLLLAAGGGILIFTLGAFVFYNTNVLQENLSKQELAERRATYERLYSQYGNTPQPQLTATKLHVELYPDQSEALVRGVYVLQNKSKVAIDTIHLSTASEVETRQVTFNRNAKAALEDREHRHAIYTLGQPLQPGDSLQLTFEVQYKPKGFTGQGMPQAVADNGTFFMNQEWLPAIGYQPSRELAEAGERKAHNLPPKPTVAPLYDEAARLNTARVERIRFEAVVGTAADQAAITTGELRRTWTEKGRRYFHYVADAPIRNLFAFFSARYAVREASWQGVQIQVLYHPKHAHNVDQLIQSTQASLDYYTRNFGPYPHRQVRLVEYPGAGNGASAYPATIALTENFSMMNPKEDKRGFDLSFAVAAHEMAHQWWAHQLVPAAVEGAALLSESLAWYSALGVVEAAHGPEHLQHLLWIMRESYLTPRSKADVPLLLATDAFQAYRKGPFAMYALKEYLGEGRVNSALQNLLAKHGTGEPPLPTSLDLYRELSMVTPDSLQYLLSDLFEKNTFWDLQAKAVEAEEVGNGQWRVALDVRAQKAEVDTEGVETPVPLDDMVEVGVYGAGKDGSAGELLYLELHRIRAGEQRIYVTVPGKPTQAGIDPRNLLIDLDMMDNVREVILKKPAAPAQALHIRQPEQLLHFMLDVMF